MLASFRSFVQKKTLLKPEKPTLLAVSGGIDSVVMADLFHTSKLRFAIAHCNFKLRGTAAMQDARWVAALAKRYQVPFYKKGFDTAHYAKAQGISIQMAARQLRYDWFEQLCVLHGFECVATAHHWDDSLETIWLNLVRGTGIAGLHGILPQQGRLIRPLLFASKAQIIEYAKQEGLTWREDASNQQSCYRRNHLRNRIVPLLKEMNPRLEATSKQTVTKLQQVEQLFQAQVAAFRKRIVQEISKECYHIHVDELVGKPWQAVVLFELVRPWGFRFAQVERLLKKNTSGKVIFSSTYQLHVDRLKWMITPRQYSKEEPSLTCYTLTRTASLLVAPFFKLSCITKDYEGYVYPIHTSIAALDLDKLRFPLQVRPWQPGDFFYPLGTQHRKKLSDFLIDQKIPLPAKRRVYVVTTGQDIAWVVGLRIDHRYRLTKHAQHVYEMQMQPM